MTSVLQRSCRQSKCQIIARCWINQAMLAEDQSLARFANFATGSLSPPLSDQNIFQSTGSPASSLPDRPPDFDAKQPTWRFAVARVNSEKETSFLQARLTACFGVERVAQSQSGATPARQIARPSATRTALRLMR